MTRYTTRRESRKLKFIASINWTTDLLNRCADAYSQPTKPLRWERAQQLGLDLRVWLQYREFIINPTDYKSGRLGKARIRDKILADQGGCCARCGAPSASTDRLCLANDNMVVCGVCNGPRGGRERQGAADQSTDQTTDR